MTCKNKIITTNIIEKERESTLHKKREHVINTILSFFSDMLSDCFDNDILIKM